MTVLSPLAYIVEEQLNPSSDFFVLPAVRALGFNAVRLGFADAPSAAELTGALVVFVRYVPPRWLKRVEQSRALLRGLAFFMDDDVLDSSAAREMPWRYRLKLRRLATARKRWLQQQQAALWVSTPYLQQKYAAWQPKLVLPSAVPAPAGLIRFFYHGSASHRHDMRWLQPVVAEALRRDPRLVFEIIGGREVAELYKKLPRTTVVQPMKWPAYQSVIATHAYHIGLNPLQDVAFNRARSYTKFFDITRCRAVGIYSPDSACADAAGDNEAGLVVELEPAAWVDAILRLADDENLRLSLFQNAECKVRALTMMAQLGYADLLV